MHAVVNLRGEPSGQAQDVYIHVRQLVLENFTADISATKKMSLVLDGKDVHVAFVSWDNLEVTGSTTTLYGVTLRVLNLMAPSTVDPSMPAAQ